jgi:hypothetical protein
MQSNFRITDFTWCTLTPPYLDTNQLSGADRQRLQQTLDAMSSYPNPGWDSASNIFPGKTQGGQLNAVVITQAYKYTSWRHDIDVYNQLKKFQCDVRSAGDIFLVMSLSGAAQQPQAPAQQAVAKPIHSQSLIHPPCISPDEPYFPNGHQHLSPAQLKAVKSVHFYVYGRVPYVKITWEVLVSGTPGNFHPPVLSVMAKLEPILSSKGQTLTPAQTDQAMKAAALAHRSKLRSDVIPALERQIDLDLFWHPTHKNNACDLTKDEKGVFIEIQASTLERVGSKS